MADVPRTSSKDDLEEMRVKFQQRGRAVTNVFEAAPRISGEEVWVKLLRKVGLRDRAFLCACHIALPCALITVLIRWLASKGLLPWIHGESDKLLKIETSVWTSIVGGIAFLVVFRASQAYTRYWQAISSVQLLQTDWFEACSSILAFCAGSKKSRDEVQIFKHLMVRLFSMLNAAALLRLVEPGLNDDCIVEMQVLDPTMLDSAHSLAYQECVNRLELVEHWIQTTTLHAMSDGIVAAAPPIVSRSFQELAQGMVKFHDALKVKVAPFPRMYSGLCDLLLSIHWLATPILTSLWVNSVAGAGLMAFVSVFLVWSVVFVARSIENPFSSQHFIVAANEYQEDFNNKLQMLLSASARCRPSLENFCDIWEPSDEIPIKDYWAALQDLSPEKSKKALVDGATTASRVNPASESRGLGFSIFWSDAEDTGFIDTAVRRQTINLGVRDSKGDTLLSESDPPARDDSKRSLPCQEGALHAPRSPATARDRGPRLQSIPSASSAEKDVELENSIARRQASIESEMYVIPTEGGIEDLNRNLEEGHVTI